MAMPPVPMHLFIRGVESAVSANAQYVSTAFLQLCSLALHRSKRCQCMHMPCVVNMRGMLYPMDTMLYSAL